MTRFLASVANAGEAAAALAVGVDIIDVKNPVAGALGAASLEDISAIVKLVGGKVPVSATIGDLIMSPALIRTAVRATAATGVDYVKIGVFPEGDACATIQSLRNMTSDGVKLAAVLFADLKPDFRLIDALANSGFAAVMLDTARKSSGRLTDCQALGTLGAFIRRARRRGLMTGLAGSLRAADIPVLLPLKPDILGFRGALCDGSVRTAGLSEEKARVIRRLMDAAAPEHVQAASEAA